MKSTFKYLIRLAVLAAVIIGFEPSALADQPRLEAALGNLRAARAELTKAVRRNGERDLAIMAIDRAISEIQAGQRRKAR